MSMHRRQLSLLAAVLLPCTASSASAQLRDQQHPTTPSYFVLSIGPQGALMTVNEIRWGSVPSVAEPGAPESRGAALQSRLGGAPAGKSGSTPASKPVSNSVELIWITHGTDTATTWSHVMAARTANDITITAMSSIGQPLARYLLRNAIPTRFWLDQMDAGGSHLPLSHAILVAQSVSVLPTGT